MLPTSRPLPMLLCLLLLSASQPIMAQEISPVEIVNFPDVQNVTGQLKITHPTPHSRMFSRHEILVSPGSPTQPGDAVAAGTIDASGFTDLVLSVHGLTSDRIASPGKVIVALIPDEAPFRRAFEEDGQRLLSIESQAEIASSSTNRFVGKQVESRLAFPRYRIYLFNTSDRSVTVDLYAYLTN